MPPIPALQNSRSCVRKEPCPRCAALACIKRLQFWRQPTRIAHNTQGPWTIYSIFVPQLQLQKNGDNSPSFFLKKNNLTRMLWGSNVVRFKWKCSRIAELYRNPRYYYKQRTLLLYGCRMLTFLHLKNWSENQHLLSHWVYGESKGVGVSRSCLGIKFTFAGGEGVCDKGWRLSLVSWLIFGIIFNLKMMQNEWAFPNRLVFSGSKKY